MTVSSYGGPMALPVTLIVLASLGTHLGPRLAFAVHVASLYCVILLRSVPTLGAIAHPDMPISGQYGMSRLTALRVDFYDELRFQTHNYGDRSFDADQNVGGARVESSCNGVGSCNR